MTAALLDHLRGSGVALDLTLCGNIHYRAPAGVLTPNLKDAMRRHKPELLAALRGDYLTAASALLVRYADTLPPDDWWGMDERFNERAGICEIDGGMTRSEAERQAYIEAARAVEVSSR